MIFSDILKKFKFKKIIFFELPGFKFLLNPEKIIY
tara:strand:- start:9 stop:113 length:105 start_codon:yes stop_codon:yes gene_type:complete